LGLVKDVQQALPSGRRCGAAITTAGGSARTCHGPAISAAGGSRWASTKRATPAR